MINIIKHLSNRIKEGMLSEIWTETVWIYQYARHYWKAMIFYTLLGLVGTVVTLISSLISRDMVDIVTGQKAGLLVQTFSLYIGFAIGNILVSQASSYFSNKISLGVDNSIKADVFEKILCTDLESLQRYHTGDLLTRWSADASAISNGILNWIPNLVICTVRFIATFALVIFNDPMFALLAMMGIPVSVLLSRRQMKRMHHNNKESAAINAKMSGFNQETFSNIQTIKAFDLILLYGQRLRQFQKEYFSMRMKFQKLAMASSAVMALVGLVVSYSSYGFGIHRVWSGAISYGTMTMFLALSGSLTSTLNQLISLVPSAISMTTSAGRLMDILEMPREDYSGTEEVDALWAANITSGICIGLQNLSYSYHNGTEVLRNVSLQAFPHEIVALVGPSGEGKTTLLRLMLSLLHPQEGSTTLCGMDNGEHLSLSPAARRLFSYVPQGNTMFSGTIAENMRSVNPAASDTEIWGALESACALDFVSKLPDGIHSKVGERGIGFSEGQSQRLSIARALLRRSPILLLDEATSALDAATERQLIVNIMKDDSPRTCIITTHRPAMMSICHKVYAIQNKTCNLLSKEEIRAMDLIF